MIYNEMSKYYDKLTYDVDYREIIKFYKSIFENLGKAPRNLLELGCGTGNVTSLLSGYNIYAIDLSEEMLGIARGKLSNKRNVHFFNMDMRNFKFEKKFDVAISALDSVNYIVEKDDLEKVFANAYAHLLPGALFVFDINSYYKISSVLGNNTFTDEVDDTLYIWHSNYNENTKICDYLMTFFIEREGGFYERFSETHRERAYTIEELKSLLLKVGFFDVNVYDGFSLEKPRDDSERLSFVAIKGE